MAGWIKMPLDMALGLGPGDFVLDRDPAFPPQKGSGAPNFRPMSNSWMDEAGTWHGGKLQTAGWIKMPLGMEVALVQATLC